MAKRIPKETCPHVGEMKILQADARACSVCGITEHLRLCTTCGAVHCCESGNAHNTAHHNNTGHPIIITHDTPYQFTWCYACNAYLT